MSSPLNISEVAFDAYNDTWPSVSMLINDVLEVTRRTIAWGASIFESVTGSGIR